MENKNSQHVQMFDLLHQIIFIMNVLAIFGVDKSNYKNDTFLRFFLIFEAFHLEKKDILGR